MKRLILFFLVVAWSTPAFAPPTWKAMGVRVVPIRASQCPFGFDRLSINHSTEVGWAAFCYG